MMEDYERAQLVITEFDVEDVITTSGITPSVDPLLKYDKYEGLLS